tara:strand:- start:9433 stop:9870 length:438 start_codon:yes stop_codon:yes gene_type:complete
MISIKRNNANIYRPVEISSSINVDGTVSLSAMNSTDSILKSVGVYISKAKNIGEAIKPSDFDSHIDFNNIIEWGNKSIRENTYGGLIFINSNGTEQYFNSSRGSKKSNKIVIGTLQPGEIVNFSLKLESPTGVSSRRLFIAVNVE